MVLRSELWVLDWVCRVVSGIEWMHKSPGLRAHSFNLNPTPLSPKPNSIAAIPLSGVCNPMPQALEDAPVVVDDGPLLVHGTQVGVGSAEEHMCSSVVGCAVDDGDGLESPNAGEAGTTETMVDEE